MEHIIQNTNGPPAAIYGTLRKWNSESFRVTLQGYFLTTSGAILVGHGLAGLWTEIVTTYYLYSLPVVFLAIFIGGHINRRIHPDRFSKYIYIFLIITGLTLLVKG